MCLLSFLIDWVESVFVCVCVLLQLEIYLLPSCFLCWPGSPNWCEYTVRNVCTKQSFSANNDYAKVNRSKCISASWRLFPTVRLLRFSHKTDQLIKVICVQLELFFVQRQKKKKGELTCKASKIIEAHGKVWIVTWFQLSVIVVLFTLAFTGK